MCVWLNYVQLYGLLQTTILISKQYSLFSTMYLYNIRLTTDYNLFKIRSNKLDITPVELQKIINIS